MLGPRSESYGFVDVPREAGDSTSAADGVEGRYSSSRMLFLYFCLPPQAGAHTVTSPSVTH